MSRLTQERRKISTDKLPTRRVQDSPLSFFVLRVAQFKESEGFFCRQATYKGNRSTWKPRKLLSPPGLVYLHKNRAWENWEKRRKRPRKARRWLQRRQGFVCPKPRIRFFCSKVLGFRSDPSRLKYRLLRDLVYKEAMCEGSNGNRLLNTAKAVP